MYRKKFLWVLSSFLLTANALFAQIGGDNTYEFLNIPTSARVASMGGNFLSIYDNDITLTYNNPSLINEEMHNKTAFSFVDYLSDIKAGSFSYGRSFEKVGVFAAHLQFISYGDFIRTDEIGNEEGEFSASEYAFTLGWSKKIAKQLNLGADIKFVTSQFDAYTSNALLADVALTYYNDKDLSSSFIIKNIGTQIKSYIPGNREDVPFEIQMGISKKLENAPIRFSLLATNLQTYDLTYTDPENPTLTIDPLTGELIAEKEFRKFLNNFARHFVIGVELFPEKSLSVRFGYNYQKRQELKTETRPAMVGFSWGFGIKVKQFRIQYAHNKAHLSGAPNHFTITTNLSDFRK